MSTRCQIGFYNADEADLTKWEALLYRHCDGYPEGILPDLQSFLKEYKRDRNDAEELSAKCLIHLARADSGNLYCICKDFHGDIAYFYAIYPDCVKVYSTRNENPNSWQLKMNLTIGQIPDKGEEE